MRSSSAVASVDSDLLSCWLKLGSEFWFWSSTTEPEDAATLSLRRALSLTLVRKRLLSLRCVRIWCFVFAKGTNQGVLVILAVQTQESITWASFQRTRRSTARWSRWLTDSCSGSLWRTRLTWCCWDHQKTAVATPSTAARLASPRSWRSASLERRRPSMTSPACPWSVSTEWAGQMRR